jgi:hypothetical protein
MLVGQLTLLLVLCAETGGRRLPTSARPRDTFPSLMWRIRALLQVLNVDVLQAVFVCCEFSDYAVSVVVMNNVKEW